MRKTAGLLASVAILASALIGGPAAYAAETVTAGGSSFAGGILKACAADFTGATVTYTASSSGTGKSSFASGAFDFGGTDFLYTGSSGDVLPAGAKYVPVIAGPIAIIYNIPGVTALRLTPELTAKIFKGDILNWNDPEILAIQTPATKNVLNKASLKKRITPAYRTAGSGTSYNFSGYLAATTNNFTQNADWSIATGDATPRGISNASSSVLKSTVTSTYGAIGYVDLKDAAGLQTAFLKNQAGQFYQPSATGSKTFMNIHSINSNGSITLQWKKAVSGAYNATLVTYAVVKTSGTATAKGAAVKDFLNYTLNTCAPAKGKGLGYTALTGSIREKALAVVKTIK